MKNNSLLDKPKDILIIGILLLSIIIISSVNFIAGLIFGAGAILAFLWVSLPGKAKKYLLTTFVNLALHFCMLTGLIIWGAIIIWVVNSFFQNTIIPLALIVLFIYLLVRIYLGDSLFRVIKNITKRLFVFYILLGCALFLTSCSGGAAELPDRLISEYKIILKPTDKAASTFLLEETVVLNEENDALQIKMSPREIESTREGIFVNEITITPLEMDETGSVELEILTDNGERIFGGTLCDYSCPQTQVTVQDLPSESFISARHGFNVNTQPYFQTETVSFQTRNLDQGIKFSYIRPPFNNLRRILNPIINITSLGEGIVVIFGFLFTFSITSVVQPFITDLVKEKLKSRFSKEETKENKIPGELTISVTDLTVISVRKFVKQMTDVEHLHDWLDEERSQSNRQGAIKIIQERIDELAETKSDDLDEK